MERADGPAIMFGDEAAGIGFVADRDEPQFFKKMQRGAGTSWDALVP